MLREKAPFLLSRAAYNGKLLFILNVEENRVGTVAARAYPIVVHNWEAPAAVAQFISRYILGQTKDSSDELQEHIRSFWVSITKCEWQKAYEKGSLLLNEILPDKVRSRIYFEQAQALTELGKTEDALVEYGRR